MKKLNMVMATVGLMAWFIYVAVWEKNGHPFGLLIGRNIMGAVIGWFFVGAIASAFWRNKKEEKRIEKENESLRKMENSVTSARMEEAYWRNRCTHFENILQQTDEKRQEFAEKRERAVLMQAHLLEKLECSMKREAELLERLNENGKNQGD